MDEKIINNNEIYEFDYEDIKIVIRKEPTDIMIQYGRELVEFYKNNNEMINNHIYEKLQPWPRLDDYSKEEAIKLIGKPQIEVVTDNFGQFVYLESKLDEHIVTLDVGQHFILGSVSVDG